MQGRFRHQATLTLKRMFYAGRGEPFRIQGRTLRYIPGTRPTRLKYANSENDWVARYDALQLRLISENLSEGDTAIDIGAHCGQFAILMAALCGSKGRVVAFEPDPYARVALARNIKLNPSIKPPQVETLAVSDCSGEAFLYSRNGNSNSSLAASGLGSPGLASEKIPVTTVSLDDYLSERHFPQSRWVKIDAEGAEIRILRGAQRCLSGNAGIICELHPYAWAEFGTSFNELKSLAAASGRRIRYLDQDNEIGDLPTYGAVVLERTP
jgi:FkbM family methyltransferase